MASIFLTLVAGALTAQTPAPAAASTSPAQSVLIVERGEGLPPVRVPDGERLVYEAILDLGPFSGRVGTVTMTAGVEPYRPALPRPGAELDVSPERRVGWIRSYAEGGHMGYKLEHELHVRLLPQSWPSSFYRDTQSGSENRRREIRIGVRDGERVSEFRRDRHCPGCDRREHFVEGPMPWQGEHHCDKCKRGEHRVWREPEERPVPEGVVDTLSAIYLARNLVLEDRETLEFPLLTNDQLWDVTLTRGEEEVVKTPAGSFDTVQILLSTEVPEGEESVEEFEGLFGIHGDIMILAQKTTGVPVVIRGDIPLGPFNVHVRVALIEYSNTPEGFAAVE